MQRSCSPTVCMSCLDRRAARIMPVIPKGNQGVARFTHAHPWNVPGGEMKEWQNRCLGLSALFLFCIAAELPREFLAIVVGSGCDSSLPVCTLLPCRCDPVSQWQEADASLHLGSQGSSLPSPQLVLGSSFPPLIASALLSLTGVLMLKRKKKILFSMPP